MSPRIAIHLLLCALLLGTCSSQLNFQWTSEMKVENVIIPPDVDDTHDRADTGTVTTFKDGCSEKEVRFLEGGTNNTVEINLPTGITITEASMVLEGKTLGGSITEELSFNDTDNSSAWWGGTGGAPTGPPSDYKDTAYLVASYVALKNRDDIRLRTQNVVGEYAYQHFSFHQPLSDVTSFDVLYEGGGMATPEMGFSTGGIKLYIHDASGPSWELVDQFTPGEVWDERILERTYNVNPLDYIDLEGNIHLVATTFIGGPGLTAWIDTDFVNIMITGSKQDAYPMDPYMNVGGMGPKEWEHDGAFTGTVTINDTYGFRTSLQEMIDQEEQNENIEIALSLYSASPGMIELKELIIEYEIVPVNQPPSSVDDIHNGTFTFPEDTEGGIGLIDLYEFFDDDGGRENLSFTILENSADVVASVNSSTHSLDFISRENFFGVRDFQVRAFDKDGLSTDSDIFTVTATPTNDAPYLRQIGNEMLPFPPDIIELEAVEDEITKFNFTTWDIDGDTPQFSFGPSFLYEDIFLLRTSAENASCGTILVEPGNEHVGTINLSLVIDDHNLTGGESLMRQYNMSLEVRNTNDAPVMDGIDGKTGNEDEWLNFTVSASDIDFINDGDEKLVYHTNFSEAGIDPGKWEFDEEAGNFSFLPDNSLVGLYHVNFSVDDNDGKGDWSNAVIEIANVNDPPIAKPIVVRIVDSDPSTAVPENLTVNVSTEKADDPDLIHGDILVYYWDFDGDEVFDEMGLSAEWTYYEAGNYTVTLTVQDSGTPILANSTTIPISVIAIKEKETDDDDPVEDDDDEGKGDGAKETGGNSTTFLLILVIGIILLILLVIGSYTILVMRKKKGEATDQNKEYGDNDTSSQTSQAAPQTPQVAPQTPQAIIAPGSNNIQYPSNEPATPVPGESLTDNDGTDFQSCCENNRMPLYPTEPPASPHCSGIDNTGKNPRTNDCVLPSLPPLTIGK